MMNRFKLNGPWLILFTILLSAFHSNAQIFIDQSLSEGINNSHSSGQHEGLVTTGACWVDIERDGDLDLFIANGTTLVLYMNNREGVGSNDFTDISKTHLPDLDYGSSAIAAADYDNDGDDDLYVANYLQDVLLSNDGQGHFNDITKIAFSEYNLLDSAYGTSVAWGDLNNDGWLDLYVANYTYDQNSITHSADRLHINQAGSPVVFLDQSHLLTGDHDYDDAEDLRGFSFAAIMTDYDNDGWMDIYVTNDCPHGPEDNKMWKNNGDLTFTEVSQAIGPFTRGKKTRNGRVPDCASAMGIAAADLNNDGYTDYHMSNIHAFGENSVLLINQNGVLQNGSYASGLDNSSFILENGYLFTWGTTFIDYDLDRWRDLVLVGGTFYSDLPRPNFLYRNDGEMVGDVPLLTEIPGDQSGLNNLSISRTIISGDYDMDFIPDLFLTNLFGSSALYKNNIQNDNNALVIALNGAGPPLSNANGIGAKVYVTTPDGFTQYHEVSSGTGLGGGNDMAAYFGLSTFDSAEISVLWPSGIKQIVGTKAVNQKIVVNEPSFNVVWPVGHEVLVVGTEYEIRWHSSSPEPVNIYLQNLNGSHNLLAHSVPNHGSYSWNPDENLASGSGYMIAISTRDSLNFGYSNDDFSITRSMEQIHHVNSPNGGELIRAGDTTLISWAPSESTEVNIDLYKNHQFTCNLASGIRNQNAFEWIVPDSLNGNSFKIKVSSSGLLSDESDKPFSIIAWTNRNWEIDSLENNEVLGQSSRMYLSKLKVSPNPIENQAEIQYQLSKPGQVRVDLLDVAGKYVDRLFSDYQRTGTHLLPYQTNNIPEGIYWMVLSQNGKRIGVAKIVKR